MYWTRGHCQQTRCADSGHSWRWLTDPQPHHFQHQCNPFQETIAFDGFIFKYDNHFLDELRQLSTELMVYSTDESRLKSRVFGNAMTLRTIECEKRQLIEKIDAFAKTIDHFLSLKTPNASNATAAANESSQAFTQHTNGNLTSAHVIAETNGGHSTHTQTTPPEPHSRHAFTHEIPIFIQQFIESINREDYRFSQINDISSSDNISTSTQSQDFESTAEPTMSQLEPNCDTLQIVNRHKWANTDYKLGTGITLKVMPRNKVRTQTKRQKQLKFVLEKIKSLIANDIYCTKRDLYYQNVMLFDSSQRVVDEIIDDLACSLRVSRIKLNIASSTRGLVFGHLKFQNTNGVLTDCLSSPNGIAIPNDTERLSRMQSNAIFVLIVEKDATFQQLIHLEIHRKYPLIMVTGHGYPDMNTRAFIHILWNSFEIPVFGLVDGDAHGLEILCTFRHGSLALSYESPNLVVPAIKWIGILPTDIIDYKLSPSVQIPLKENDKKKIQDLKNRQYMKENIQWTRQLNLLLRIGKKVEIQSLAEHSATFLLDIYLPSKIRYGKWI
ncbi:unnamed protein product [Oppiella nova]|uniref:DNA topoisomerase (ATP-hydrolyzing) n=1 Tax=Oppiella nova TaxID=334625 RepID=A0A7R9MEU0_9ACAR|nr:unnamed protein product [Oppiella nova]CAG2176077.1 unnamed protein product [Oppiella nova]